MKKICVGLLSGGLDSCVAAAWARREGYTLYLLSVHYGQVMVKELEHAKAIATLLGAQEHRLVQIGGFNEISCSSRTRAEMIEYDKPEIRLADEIPTAYPPGRDSSFIFIASAWLETLMLESPTQVSDGLILIGTNKNDSDTFPDCRQVVYDQMNRIFEATKISVQYGKSMILKAPLIGMDKSDVVRLGIALEAPLHLTWTCYEGQKTACGRCDPCQLRLRAFSEAGIPDPISYRLSQEKNLRQVAAE